MTKWYKAAYKLSEGPGEQVSSKCLASLKLYFCSNLRLGFYLKFHPN